MIIDAAVRVKDDANSMLHGLVLTVVKTEREKNGRVMYLCEMPSYGHPGWFSEEEVERVAVRTS